MSWITIVWSMNAAACLTLGALYLLVWCKQRENWVYLVFSSSAVAAAAIAAFELAMMHCDTVGRYETLVRWIHVPVWVLIVSFVSFVRPKPISRMPRHRAQATALEKCCQFFVGSNDESLSVVAMRVSDPDRSPLRINRGDAAPTPTGFRDCSPLAPRVRSPQVGRLLSVGQQ